MFIGETNFSEGGHGCGIRPTIAREGSKLDFVRRGPVQHNKNSHLSGVL